MTQSISTNIAEVTDEVLATFSGGRSCNVEITRDRNGNITNVKTTGECGHVKVVVS